MKSKIFIFSFVSAVSGIIVSILGSKQVWGYINKPYEGEDDPDEFSMDRH